MKNTPSWIILHHSGGIESDPLFDTSNQTFEEIDLWHKQRWSGETKSQLGFYCGYHYVIDKNGKVTQARRDLEGGAHTIGMNYSSIGICMTGNFDITYPTPAQIKALAPLLSKLQGLYLVPSSRVVPHRLFAKKSCFGILIENVFGEKVIQEHTFTDSFVRGILKKLVALRIIIEPRLSLIFGSLNNGPLNKYEAD